MGLPAPGSSYLCPLFLESNEMRSMWKIVDGASRSVNKIAFLSFYTFHFNIQQSLIKLEGAHVHTSGPVWKPESKHECGFSPCTLCVPETDTRSSAWQQEPLSTQPSHQPSTLSILIKHT